LPIHHLPFTIHHPSNMSMPPSSFADLEIRILKREANGCPVELPLNGERQFVQSTQTTWARWALRLWLSLRQPHQAAVGVRMQKGDGGEGGKTDGANLLNLQPVIRWACQSFSA
jgi:hypothetical protein